MKKIGRILILLFAVLMFAATKSNAQNEKMYLPAPLSPPKEAPRPPRTNKFEVWVPGDWGYDNVSKYVYRPGYWGYPPTPKSVWLAGKWEKTPKGYIRRPGYWVNPH